MSKRCLTIVTAFTLFLGCVDMRAAAPVAALPAGPRSSPRLQKRAEETVAGRLVGLLDERKLQRLSNKDFENTALGEIIKLTTPAGYRIKYRFLELGVPLAQALSLCRDPQMKNRLVEAARWANSPRARTEGLLALATLQDPEHFKYFREAMLDSNPGIQVAAIQALQVWGRPEGLPLLLKTAEINWSPLVRVFAAQTALRMGDDTGRQKLLQFLSDTNWFMRALSARYLGELGKAEDADILINRINREQDNRFTLAEVCIASLNLLSKRPGMGVANPPKPVGPKPRMPTAADVFEMEPLVITAPRLRISGEQLVDVRIDNQLALMLEKLATEPPPDEQIVPVELEELNNLFTPTGFALKVRYADISFLLTEGLAGTSNYTLINRLETIAKSNPNSRVRAAALVALGYDPRRRDLFIFQDALRDPSFLIRYGAVEALAAQTGNPSTRPLLAAIAQSDPSPSLRLYAASVLTQTGDPYGIEILRRGLGDQDWVLRSMSAYFLGQLGDESDFERVLSGFNREDNDYASTEDALAALRLAQ